MMGVPVDPIVTVSVIMGIGMCVDYLTHVLYYFYVRHVDVENVEKRVRCTFL